jgi:ankyrin repeat protein
MRLLPLLCAAAVLAPASAFALPDPSKPSKADLLKADLFVATTNGDLAATKAAVAAGADINGRNWLDFSPVMNAAMGPSFENVKFLVEHGARVNDDSIYGSALSFATQGGRDQNAAYLIKKGARINPKRFDKTTPLMVASSKGMMATLGLILKQKPNLEDKNDDGATALIFAARGNQPEAVKKLLAAGAKVNTADSTKRTPLHYAALDGSSQVASLLLAKGASVKAVDSTGATPLNLVARYSGDAETTKALLRAGSDVNHADGKGKTPLSIATLREYEDAANLLSAAGGQAGDKAQTPLVTQAVGKSLVSIQTGMKSFTEKAKCVACHHHGLGLMTLAYAAQAKLEVDPKLIGLYMGQMQEDGKAGAAVMHAAATNPKLIKMVPAVDIGDFPYGAAYFMGAARTLGAPPNPGFAEVSVVVGGQQRANGLWRHGFERGSMQHSYFTTCALTVEALKKYWPADRKADLDQRMAKALNWAKSTKTECAEDLAGKLLLLKAAGGSKEEIEVAAKDLELAQAPEGGWRPPHLSRSDAYTTGLSIFALRTAAGRAGSYSAIDRGLKFLVRTQDEDGTWYVPKQVAAYNNHFDASFPHGYAQYASFAGTCWATIGMIEALGMRPTVASR